MTGRPRIAVLSGAGMSAESGLKTFRDHDGLWENHRVEDVATPQAWERDPDLVLRFYNERRRALASAAPNRGHSTVASWEKSADVEVITQNVDDLHERAGSTSVLHLHGELVKARSTADPSLVTEIGCGEINPQDRCPLGSPLRPHIVWFGEAVPAMEEAAERVARADALVIVGTSLQVYPAASLAWAARPDAARILIDPSPPDAPDFHVIASTASEGLAAATDLLARHFGDLWG
jgi:NAD-dependent deacetylase